MIYTPPRKGDFGPSFMSVIGNGVVRKITSSQEKLLALRTIIHHYVNTIPVAISTDDVKNVSVWVIEERHGKHYENGAVAFDDFDYEKLDDTPDAESSASQKK
ncbi:hypothetical protein ACERHZ_00120 [Lactobacillus acidophilus]